jgi:hypothetical protein
LLHASSCPPLAQALMQQEQEQGQGEEGEEEREELRVQEEEQQHSPLSYVSPLNWSYPP